MSNGNQTANDITDEQVQKLLRFVEDNRQKKRTVKSHRGDKGECWSLPFKALIEAGADKPCQDCGDDALYVWGRRVDGLSLASGDIIQVEGVATLTSKDNARTLDFPHKHHSMIVIAVESPGADGPVVKVAHQWVGHPVSYDTVRLGSKTGAGVLYFYRPQSTKK